MGINLYEAVRMYKPTYLLNLHRTTDWITISDIQKQPLNVHFNHYVSYTFIQIRYAGMFNLMSPGWSNIPIPDRPVGLVVNSSSLSPGSLARPNFRDPVWFHAIPRSTLTA